MTCPVHGGDAWAAVRMTARDDARFRRRRRIGAAWRQQHAQAERLAVAPLRRFFQSMRDRIVERLRRETRPLVLEEVFQAGEYRAAFLSLMRRSLRGGVFSGLEFEAQVSGGESGEQQALAWWRGIWQDARGDNGPPSIYVDLSDSLRGSIEEWLDRRNVGVWNSVSSTTATLLARSIRRGLEDGLSMTELANSVRDRLTHYADWQAIRVARTEMTGSLNFGQQIERQNLDIPGKEWVSTLDNRNRGARPGSPFDHLAPDGQIVANDGLFVVSGQQLEFPGDSSQGASAGNVINCRCASVGAWPDAPLDVPAARTPRPILAAPENAVPPPAWITAPGPRSQFAQKVYKALGATGITSESDAVRIGKLINAEARRRAGTFEMEKDLARLEKWRNRSKKQLDRAIRKADQDAVRLAEDDLIETKRRTERRIAQIATGLSREFRNVLMEVRDFGGFKPPVTVEGDEQSIENQSRIALLRAAERAFPTDWLRTSGQTTLRLLGGGTDPGKYDDETGTMTMSDDAVLIVFIHELAHRMEKRGVKRNGFPDLMALQDQYLRRRAGPNPRWIDVPNYQGMKAFDAGFVDPYIGIDYGGHAYEVLSSGMMGHFFPSWHSLVSQDRDYSNFVLGVLAGL